MFLLKTCYEYNMQFKNPSIYRLLHGVEEMHTM
jgi:hypothetical protein